MNLQFKNEVKDARGKIRFYSFGKMKINLIETRKGFARGSIITSMTKIIH